MKRLWNGRTDGRKPICNKSDDSLWGQHCKRYIYQRFIAFQCKTFSQNNRDWCCFYNSEHSKVKTQFAFPYALWRWIWLLNIDWWHNVWMYHAPKLQKCGGHGNFLPQRLASQQNVVHNNRHIFPFLYSLFKLLPKETESYFCDEHSISIGLMWPNRISPIFAFFRI